MINVTKQKLSDVCPAQMKLSCAQLSIASMSSPNLAKPHCWLLAVQHNAVNVFK
jgi:hypothetical protein